MAYEDIELAESVHISYPSASNPLSLCVQQETDKLQVYFTYHRMRTSGTCQCGDGQRV